jgi:hypothetical protein
VRTSHETRLLASTACYGENLICSYVDDVRTTQETPVALHGLWQDAFTFFIYADDVRTSLEAHASTACYGNNVTVLYVDDVRTAVGDPPRWPRDTPLSTKVGAKLRRQVTVAQSV